MKYNVHTLLSAMTFAFVIGVILMMAFAPAKCHAQTAWQAKQMVRVDAVPTTPTVRQKWCMFVAQQAWQLNDGLQGGATLQQQDGMIARYDYAQELSGWPQVSLGDMHRAMRAVNQAVYMINASGQLDSRQVAAAIYPACMENTK